MSRSLSLPIPVTDSRAVFTGIDRRRIQGAANPNSAWDAKNYDLTPGGKWKTRDVLRQFQKLHSDTIGLYSLGGTLRTAAPTGNNLKFLETPDIQIDEFGNSEVVATSTSRYVRLTSYSSWGATVDNGGQPYIVLETDGGQYEHHWLDQVPGVPNGFLDTRVQLGFEPTAEILKLAGHIWAPNRYEGTVHHSSTEFGPGTWLEAIAPGDAGFINPLIHNQGVPTVRGLAQHQGQLVVVFDNSMQFWNVDPDPALNSFSRSILGPGTKAFPSLSNVVGDIYYFSEGGFRSLLTQTITGELREGDLGAPIIDLTQKYINFEEENVLALWSQARSQYICMFRNGDGTTTAFVFTLSPTFSVAGWSYWELPVDVEYLVELDGELYLRAGDMVYVFMPGQNEDELETGAVKLDSVWESQFIHGGDERRHKVWHHMDVVQEGKISKLYLLTNNTDRDERELLEMNVEGTTSYSGLIPLSLQSHNMAVRLECDTAQEFDKLTFDYDTLVGMG